MSASSGSCCFIQFEARRPITPARCFSDSAQPRNQVPQYAYAICYSGLDDGPQGNLPFLLPSQLANIIPSLHFETLRGCIESGDIVFDLFVHVPISQSALPCRPR
jgi:hypothetical protein